MTGEAKTRHLQSTLSIAGSAVVAFCVWSFAKIGLFLAFFDENTVRWLLGIDDASFSTTLFVLLGIIALVDLGLRIYVGLSARAEGHGKKKSSLYLVIAAIAAIANAASLVVITLGTSFSSSLLGMIVSIIIEVTAIAALVLVIYSSIRLRRMNKTTE